MADQIPADSDNPSLSNTGKPTAFPKTRWSLIASLGDVDERSASEALSELCDLYWYPVYAYIRRSGRSPEDAEDLTQDFFANVVRRGDLKNVTQRSSARFRSYILAAVKNLLTSDHRQQSAKRRGGTAIRLSIDAEVAEKRYRNEPAESLTPEDLFERRWALTVIDTALQNLKAEYERSDRGKIFARLQPLIPLKNDTGQYADAAQQLGMSDGAIQVAMHRLRKRYQTCIREQIAHTVASEEEVEGELRYIFGLFAT
jgi:RNA polymerase sigma factor (sigma-70 family)